MTNSNIEWLQDFFFRLCDGDWEHGDGFQIETLDNPGWMITFNLEDTRLVDKGFERVRVERDIDDWIDYKLDGAVFKGSCGVMNLEELLGLFRAWVENNLGPNESPWSQ